MQIIGKLRPVTVKILAKSLIFLFSDPEDSIGLTYRIDEQEESVDVICSVHNIFPLPEVKLL